MSKYIYIIAEYNPPHTGHKYMIDELRRRFGDDATVICIMSGNFTERGSVAIANKYARAKAALFIGADLVLSLPFPWCVSSAEYFARAGVSIATGLASALPTDEHILAFGSESGDADAIKLVGARLASAEFRQKLDSLPTIERTARGIERSYSEMYKDGTADLLTSPNNTLAVEYVRAINELGSSLTPVTVKRLGASHDAKLPELHPSASYLRDRICVGEDVCGLIPDNAYCVLRDEFEAYGAACDENYGDALLGILRLMSPKAIDGFAECAAGVGRRLISTANSSASFAEALSSAATKQYTNARLRRASIFAAVGVTQSEIRALPKYTSVLAANEKGTLALRSFSKQSNIAILTKSADAALKLDNSAMRQFELDAHSDTLYALAFRPHLSSDAFRRNSPAILKKNSLPKGKNQ